MFHWIALPWKSGKPKGNENSWNPQMANQSKMHCTFAHEIYPISSFNKNSIRESNIVHGVNSGVGE